MKETLELPGRRIESSMVLADGRIQNTSWGSRGQIPQVLICIYLRHGTDSEENMRQL